METPLYMRVRGRVLGPYEPEKLQAMVKRGQLSRLHELSTDGVSWVRASTYPELFVTGAELPAAQEVAINEYPMGVSGKQVDGSASMPAVAPADGSNWYYSTGGKQAGPVDLYTLQRMTSSGQLQPDDLVWSEGMAEWQAAKTINGISWQTFASVPPASIHSPQRFHSEPHSRSQSDSEAEAELPESLSRSAVGSRGWVTFVAIVMFLMAGLSALGGIALMVEGARARETRSVTGGIFSLLTAVVVAVGGFLLISYGNRLGGLRFSRAPILLERALDTLRIFWLYIGICLIVWLVFVVIFIVFGAAQM